MSVISVSRFYQKVLISSAMIAKGVIMKHNIVALRDKALETLDIELAQALLSIKGAKKNLTDTTQVPYGTWRCIAIDLDIASKLAAQIADMYRMG